MIESSRRAFLGSLGGVAIFGVGGIALGRAGVRRLLDGGTLDLGRFEELATLIQETPPGKLQSLLIARLRAGLALEDLVAAGVLANTRSFGGLDYDGYHCLMAMMPAFEMSRELPGDERFLPVLKVIHRYSRRMQATGGRDDAMHAIPKEGASGDLRACFEAGDVDGAEEAYVASCDGTAGDALHEAQSILRETLDVHRIVLAWRAWDTLTLTGEAYAETLLRQSVRHSTDRERNRRKRGHPTPELRTLLPSLVDEHGLGRGRGERTLSDAELVELADVVFAGERADAARAVAAKLGGGARHEDVGEALTLAANRLLLNDPGRKRGNGSDKPVGTVHGASVGVHASDAARAWRNLASVSTDADSAMNLVAGAYHTAGQTEYVEKHAYPYAERMEGLGDLSADGLARELAAAIAENDQPRAGACAAVWGQRGFETEPLFRTLLSASLEADGALHAEKYYRTVREDFASSRPAHRWNHAITLARVCASEHGWEAPGLAEARAELSG